MYKVIIIDDEQLILDGLEQMVDWEALGCAVCASATSAEEGIEKIKEYSPDIILTDVRMKAMTGLEMLEEVIDLIPRTKIIIMTGYRNFEYAQKAISLGVSEFILKPTKIVDIQNAVKKTVKQLDGMYKMIDDVEKLTANKIQLNQLYVEKILFDILMFKTCDMESTQNKLSQYNTDFSNYLVISLDGENFWKEHISEIVPQIRAAFENMVLFDNDFYIIYSQQNINISVVLCVKDENISIDIVRNNLLNINYRFSDLFGEKVSMGVSKNGHDISEIRDRNRESYQALEHRIYTGEGAVNFYEDINLMMYDYDYLNIYQENIFSCVVAGDKGKTNVVMKDIDVYLKEQSLVEVQRFVFDTVKLYYTYYFKIKSAPWKEVNFEHLEEMIYKCDDLNILVELLFTFSEEMVGNFYKYSASILNDMINNIRQYINDNYAHSITRDDIAKYVHASPSYVSTAFKRATNTTLMQYINNVRINEAKKLLSAGKHSHQVISEMVGFNDYAYFSNTFKKHTGTSPSKWQR